MKDVLAWGLDTIRAVQRWKGEILTALMVGASFLGSQYFYFTAIPLLYWCADVRRASRIGLAVLAAMFAALALKDLALLPRPFLVDPSVGLADEPSWSFPSAHALSSAVFWGMAGLWLGGRQGIFAAIVPPLVIGFSRVYLGVHYPTDVLGGWAIGGLIVLAFRLAERRLRALLRRLGYRAQVALAALAAILINAVSTEYAFIAGALFGLGLGYVFQRRLVALDASAGTPLQKLGRASIGLAVLFLIFLAPRDFIPPPPGGKEPLLHFLQFALGGLWISLGAPLLFARAGLARARREMRGAGED